MRFFRPSLAFSVHLECISDELQTLVENMKQFDYSSHSTVNEGVNTATGRKKRSTEDVCSSNERVSISEHQHRLACEDRSETKVTSEILFLALGQPTNVCS